MPFGLQSSGATLVKCLRKLLRGMDNVHNYVDDILIHTVTWEEHLEVLEKVLDKLRGVGFTVRPTKCEFGLDKIDFLGYQLNQGVMTPQEANVAKSKIKQIAKQI